MHGKMSTGMKAIVVVIPGGSEVCGRHDRHRKSKRRGGTPMDDKALRQLKERLDKLNREVHSLTKKEQETRRRLDDELDLSRKAKAERAVLLDRLIGATVEAAEKLHRQVDGIDQQIKSSERLSESLDRLLQATKAEYEAVLVERNKINQVVGQEETARAFSLWQVTMEQNFQAATAAMAAARLTLGKLTTEAASGSERFGGQASTWSAGKFDEWEHREHNAESLAGFRPALPWFRNIIVHISPMTRA